MLAVLVTGCATKRDVRDMREDLARQDASIQALHSQNRMLMDTLTLTTERLLDLRGELANQLNQLREQVVQIGELTGQVQIRLTQLDQQLGRAGAAPGGRTDRAEPDARDPVDDPRADDDTFSMAAEFYEIGLEQLNRGNAATARRAFLTVADSFPSHPRAPDALRQLGETYAMERSWDDALRVFDRVAERYPDSDSAPRALYRAGVISQERGNLERSRQYFERVISAYPESDARRLAEEALSRLR
jgi:tol-pal system protein YbgF